LLRTTVAVAATTLVLMIPGAAGAAGHAPVRMPDLIGLSRARVYHVMHDAGLYFVTKGPGAATARWVDVTAQSPRPGTAIAWHGEAVLDVTTQSPRGPRAVPRLTGLSRAQVYAAMRRAQLYFVTLGPGSSSNSWTVAVAQSPPAGTRVAWHAEVTLHVVVHRAPVTKPTITQTAAAVIGGVGFKIGIATWYNYFPGRCATWYLPKGTRLTVRDLTTGRSVTCVITDRENEGDDHVVDLSETQFSELAPLSQGVIRVKVSW
jgi:hypothetical protein